MKVNWIQPYEEALTNAYCYQFVHTIHLGADSNEGSTSKRESFDKRLGYCSSQTTRSTEEDADGLDGGETSICQTQSSDWH